MLVAMSYKTCPLSRASGAETNAAHSGNPANIFASMAALKSTFTLLVTEGNGSTRDCPYLDEMAVSSDTQSALAHVVGGTKGTSEFPDHVAAVRIAIAIFGQAVYSIVDANTNLGIHSLVLLTHVHQHCRPVTGVVLHRCGAYMGNVSKVRVASELAGAR